MTTERTARSTSYFTIGTVALFLVGFLLLVIFGARIYRETVASQYANMDTRNQLSYLITTLRSCDERGAVTVADDMLVIRDGDSGYAFRLYLQDGQLVEDYAAVDAPLDPSAGQIIGNTSTFAIEKDGARLTVETDAGRAFVYLRGEGEAP